MFWRYLKTSFLFWFGLKSTGWSSMSMKRWFETLKIKIVR